VKYPAKIWNSLLRKAEQYLPVRFDYTPPGARPHPWQIRPVWRKQKNGKSGDWHGIITPGAVNGVPAFIKMLYGNATFEARERIRLDAVANKKPVPKDDDIVKIYVDEDAELKMSFRSIGSDSSPDSVSGDAGSGRVIGVFEKVPDFFKRLGVADANTDLLGQPSETQRLLKACDVVLNQPRVGLTNDVSISAAAVDTTLVSINPGFFVPPDREASVTGTPKYVSQEPALTFADLLFQRFIDTPTDRLHLSTFYLLSPQLPLLDPSNLEGWQPYIKYNCHHNLVHATQQIERRAEFVPLSLVVPLAGGVAQPLINYILAEANFFAQAALDFYQQRKLNGKFTAV
jgi:hypothetical protein